MSEPDPMTAWLLSRDSEDARQIGALKSQISTDPEIAHGHRHAGYARRAMLLDYLRAMGAPV